MNDTKASSRPARAGIAAAKLVLFRRQRINDNMAKVTDAAGRMEQSV